jgi:shikimate kinase
MTSRIFLVGFMGSGKSTIGKLLAQTLGFRFIDLDTHIETVRNKTISEIFSLYGEHGFRAIEQEALHSLAVEHDIVVASGGGTPCFYDNMLWMVSNGTVIFLDCSVQSLFERLKSEQEHRPLIKDFAPLALEQFISKKLAERRPYYTQAAIQVFEMKDKAATVQWILQALEAI